MKKVILYSPPYKNSRGIIPRDRSGTTKTLREKNLKRGGGTKNAETEQ
ncbi:hypothetical protein EV214_13136 [Marinisporobacter balticus]|uniref:Uncharacterized protein n=1 Tax=Marinisporobacter balticus TaxID=2018667 RepID=A0A4R2KBB4_9FIRM|nr:hypothetical protein EV214_13136 [Marinisporobacter balticus]